MKNKLTSKTIAIMGIVMYVLGIILSAEDLQGNLKFPSILKLISETGMLVFIIMAIFRLWKQVRFVALTLMLSNIIYFVLGVIQQIGSSNVIVLFNLSKLVSWLALLWAIITLFQKKDV